MQRSSVRQGALSAELFEADTGVLIVMAAVSATEAPPSGG